VKIGNQGRKNYNRWFFPVLPLLCMGRRVDIQICLYLVAVLIQPSLPVPRFLAAWPIVFEQVVQLQFFPDSFP
jgi:hypothetical protein